MADLPPITDRSYGIIPLRLTISTSTSSTKPVPTTQNTQLLLIHQRTRGAANFWCFPKGHPEFTDESLKHTAIRELEEETGLKIQISDLVTLYSNDANKTEIPLRETYINPLRKKGKEVTYFLALVPQPQELRLQEKEVANAKWVGWEEALETITFDECREMLGVVKEAFGKNGEKGGGKGGVKI